MHAQPIGTSVGRKVFHAYPIEDRERITGSPLVSIWAAGFVLSWSVVIALGIGLALGIPRFAEYLAGL